MKKEVKVIEIGDVFTVDFIKNEKGGKPVCKINGFVGFISNESVSDFVAPRSVWQVAVSKINETSVEVVLLDKLKTPYENLREIKQKLEANFKKEKKERVKKPKVKYTNV